MKTSINERLMVNIDNLKFLSSIPPPTIREIDIANERINKIFIPSTHTKPINSERYGKSF